MNFRITRCCRSCKFFVKLRKLHRDSGRGYCKYPDPSSKQLKQLLGESYDKEVIKNTWIRTHSTCLCDLYQLRSKKIYIGEIGKWVEKPFSNDGTLKEDDE